MLFRGVPRSLVLLIGLAISALSNECSAAPCLDYTKDDGSTAQWCCTELIAEALHGYCKEGSPPCLMNLQNKGISRLPVLGTLDCASKIKVVEIWENSNLQSLTGRLFAGLGNLAKVQIYNNPKLQSLSSDLLAETSTSLRSFVLENLPMLGTLPDCLFADCMFLENLWLENNGILSLPSTLLANKPNLIEVQINKNKNLISLPVGFFSTAPQLAKVTLLDNAKLQMPTIGVFNVPALLESYTLKTIIMLGIVPPPQYDCCGTTLSFCESIASTCKAFAASLPSDPAGVSAVQPNCAGGSIEPTDVPTVPPVANNQPLDEPTNLPVAAQSSMAVRALVVLRPALACILAFNALVLLI